jgi:hypothetical protein
MTRHPLLLSFPASLPEDEFNKRSCVHRNRSWSLKELVVKGCIHIRNLIAANKILALFVSLSW